MGARPPSALAGPASVWWTSPVAGSRRMRWDVLELHESGGVVVGSGRWYPLQAGDMRVLSLHFAAMGGRLMYGWAPWARAAECSASTTAASAGCERARGGACGRRATAVLPLYPALRRFSPTHSKSDLPVHCGPHLSFRRQWPHSTQRLLRRLPTELFRCSAHVRRDPSRHPSADSSAQAMTTALGGRHRGHASGPSDA